MNKLLSTLIVLLTSAVYTMAQTVDTISVYSKAMNKNVKNVVILPEGYKKNNSMPVVYLLHGYTGTHQTWLEINPELPQLASHHNVIIVCPDAKASWYIDSPVDPTSKYETFVSSELVSYIDQHYNTVRSNSGRAITGFSMGGYGAMWQALHHQDVFGACGATSGGVDIRPFPDKWEIKKVMGEQSTNHKFWEEHCIAANLHLVKPGLSIIFDCGTEDFFAPVNEQLHKEMVHLGIRHDYISRPGIHNNAYWANAITYHLQFSSDFFRGRHTYERQLIYNSFDSVPENL